MSRNLQIRLKSSPHGPIGPEHFEQVEADMPAAGDGEILCRNLYLSLDPYMRSQIAGRHMSGAVRPGDVMRGETVAEVVASNHPDFAPGDRVAHFGGWQSHAASPGAAARKLPDHDVPPSLYLGILGMPGLTAYASILHVGRVQAGDMVCVSAASGPVGSMVGQIARIAGARVVGIAGSDDKCRFVTEELGFEGAVNYRTTDLTQGLKAACPDGIDVYHDNVGAEVLEAAMANLAQGARIVLCGLIKQYSADTVLPGPPLGPIFAARATMRAVIVYDHEHRRSRFERDVAGWIADGRVRYREDRVDGLDQAPHLFARLMRGENFGKCVVKLA